MESYTTTTLTASSDTAAKPSLEWPILAAIMEDPARLAIAQECGLSPRHFDDLRHAPVLRAIEALARNGKAIDPLSVPQAMPAAALKAIGGLGLFAAIDEAASTLTIGTSFKTAVEAVVEAGERRMAQRALQAALEALNDSEGLKAADILKDAQEGLTQTLGIAGLPRIVVPIGSLSKPAGDKTLLGNRWLCRGGAALVVSKTGIGKSSFTMQAAMYWGVGKPFAGIAPHAPMRTLIIQAENDEGDLFEMVDGVRQGCGLEAEDLAVANSKVDVCTCDDASGSQFVAALDKLLCAATYDLVVIDPLFAYSGCSVSDQERMSEFLRLGLQPTIRRHNVGLVLVHHENKPPKEEGANGWTDRDHAYSGSGTAELANWARATLTISTTSDDHAFTLVAGKRGGRLGWTMTGGHPATRRCIAHAEGTICWEDWGCDEVKPPKGRASVDDLLAYIPEHGTILKDTLIRGCDGSNGRRRIGQNAARALIKQAVDDNAIQERQETRNGVRPAIYISRTLHD